MKHTLELKIEAVRLMRGGQSGEAVVQALGVPGLMPHSWVKADVRDLLRGVAARPVSPKQLEINRLRAELTLVT